MKRKQVAAKIVEKTAKSVLRGIRYHSGKALNRPQDLTFLVYSVTRRCNSRCVMCGIWEEAPSPELAPQELAQALASGFFSRLRYVNLTGGEPFLRDDLAEMAGMFGALPDMKAIQIPTNGFLTGRITETAGDILGRLPQDVYLSITVSLDGDGPVHDTIRGMEGAYDRAVATLRRLQSVEDPRLIAGVATTVSAANVDSIDRIYNHLKGLSGHVGFYPAIISGSFYGNEGRGAVRMDQGQTAAAVRFFSMLRDREPAHAFYYDGVANLLKTGARSFECLAGLKTAYLSADGELFPCLMLADRREYSFGRARDGLAAGAWTGGKGALVRKRLARDPVCSRCSLSCDLINNFNEEFFEMSYFYLRNPRISMRLLNDIRHDRIKPKNLSE